MSAHDKHTPESIAETTRYPVGLIFDVKFEVFAVRLNTLPNNELRYYVSDGPYPRLENVSIVVTLLRPGLLIVTWVERDGATVVHVKDFALGVLYYHATVPDGTFLQMKASLRIAPPEVL